MLNTLSFLGKTRRFFAGTASFAFIAAAVIFAPACHKSNSSSSPTYYIKATINGKDSTFSYEAGAVMQTLNGENTLVLTASHNNASIGTLAFTIASNQSIGVGTYTAGDVSNPNLVMSAAYDPSSSVSLLYGGISNQTGVNPFVVNISQLDGKTAKGTFSGDLISISNGQSDPSDKKTFTNGSFYLNFR